MSRDIYIIVVIDPACLTREYAKTSKENVDKITVLFQADPQKIKLLFILDNQIELLAKERRPDLSCFFDSFELHSIAWSEEVLYLRANYGRERINRGIIRVLDIYTNAICSNNRTRYYKTAWILLLTE
jgi:hypothetical protein